MSKPEYYWRWIKTACRGAGTQIDLWVGMVGAILIVLAHYLPSVQAAVTDLMWQLLLWIAIPIILLRLFVLAPYWIAKTDADKIDLQQKEIDYLKDELKPRLVITGIFDETEPAQATYWLTEPGIRTVKIEVENTGATILRECLVKLEDLSSEKDQIFKWKNSQLREKFALRPGERICVAVATLDEKDSESEIILHIQTPLISCCL